MPGACVVAASPAPAARPLLILTEDCFADFFCHFAGGDNNDILGDR